MTDLLRIVQRELSPPSKISLLILKDNFHPASVHDYQDSVGCGRGGGIMGETRERGNAATRQIFVGVGSCGRRDYELVIDVIAGVSWYGKRHQRMLLSCLTWRWRMRTTLALDDAAGPFGR